jgi:D-serine deaminase-like pyridoxal phosphate-dependent protein
MSHSQAAAGVHDEVQPGSFAFMDSVYGKALSDTTTGRAGGGFFAQSLFVACTVISVSGDHAVVDAGTKAVDQLAGPPTVWRNPRWFPPLGAGGRGARGAGADGMQPCEGINYKCGGDEHGILEGGAVGALAVGDTLLLQPSHCDPTVNLHDAFVFVGSGQDGAPALEAPVPIGARGPGC